MLQGRIDKIEFDNIIVVTPGNQQKIKDLLKGELEGASLSADVRKQAIKYVNKQIDNVLIAEGKTKTRDIPKAGVAPLMSPAERGIAGAKGGSGTQDIINQAKIRTAEASVDTSGKKIKTGVKYFTYLQQLCGKYQGSQEDKINAIQQSQAWKLRAKSTS